MESNHRRLLRYARHSNNALVQNAAHQFAAAHAMGIYQAAAIYSFIPKNACSTMRFSIALANGCIASEAQVHWIHNNNETFPPNLSELATARYSFVVLRDPFRRIASCFLDKFVGRRPEAWRFVEVLDHAIDLDHLTFREFVTTLPKFLRVDQHWRPQVDFLVYEQYDDWFCLEDFSRVVATLDRKIGFTVRDTRHLLLHGTERHRIVASKETLADTPGHDIATMKRNGEIPAVESLFDDEIIGVIRKIYADDFAIYAEMIGLPCLFA